MNRDHDYGPPTAEFPGYMELIRDDVRISLEDIGEGVSGDYDPDDPDDTPLLRFYVSELAWGDEVNEAGQREVIWHDVDDASYCTNIPATISVGQAEKLLHYLMSWFLPALNEGKSVKKLGERLSWIGPEWIENPPDEEELLDRYQGHFHREEST